MCIRDRGTGQFERGIHIGFQRDFFAATQAFVGGDDELAGAVGHAVGNRVGCKAAKHHHMDCADTGAGQHRDGRLRDHRQINGHPVALANTQIAQCVGQLANTRMQLAVGEFLYRRVWAVGLENQRGFVAAFFQMPIQTIHAGIELAIGKPTDAEVFQIKADIFDDGGRDVPIQTLGQLAPKRIWVLLGLCEVCLLYTSRCV